MFWTVTLSLLEGFWMTLKLFGLTLAFAIPIGLVLGLGSMSRFKPLKKVVELLVWVIRGTPLLLQLIVIYYGPGLIFKMGSFWGSGATGRFVATLVAFVINYSCYFSVIYRGGIEAIPKGQYEAGQVLGMTKSQIFFKVILLQVIKRIVPPMSNEIITLVKDTSLARVIACYEIIWNAQAFIKSDGLIWPLFYTGVFYLLFSGLLTIFFGWLERKMDYFRV
ncbi:MAG: amino acid ABC transporter permease [Ruminococcaceae bacterium]|nr:amino acid ABC transporter permease [Oscillospiraceae bacterium]